ncbi:unnamed protein product, partial [Prorocentrum cordatum]
MRPGYLQQILSGPIAAGLLALGSRRQPCPAPPEPPSCPETCAEAPACVCPGAPACVCPEPAACPPTELGWEEVLIIGVATWAVQTGVGRHYLAWYDGDDVYHEQVALWPQTHARWVILTPDFDMYSEMLDGSEGVDGVVRIIGLRPDGRLPRLDKPAYRFKQALDLDALKGYIREGRRLALQDGTAAGDPPIEVADVVMPDREVVPLDTMFGGRFLPRRLPLRRGAAAAAAGADDGPPGDAAAGSDAGAAPALAAVGDGASPVYPQAGPLDTPRGYAWLLMEGGNLGDEVVLGPDDFRLSDYDAMILRRGQGRRAELVPLTEVDDCVRARREELADQLRPAGAAPLPPPLGLPPGPSAEAPEGADAAGGTATPPPVAEDARTLWIDYDEQGERYKPYRKAVQESFS